jgi:hypothetical protein
MRKGRIFFDAAMTLAVTLIITAILIGLCVWYGPSLHPAGEFTGVVELPLTLTASLIVTNPHAVLGTIT